VAEVSGKIKRGAVMLCAVCEDKRKVLEMARRGNGASVFDQIFGGLR